MGFGMVLAMYNLRVFLHKLADSLSSRKDIKVDVVDKRRHPHAGIAGMGYEVNQLKITSVSTGEVLYEIDATDDEGYSGGGKTSSEGYQLLKKAVDDTNLEAALAAIDVLVRD